MKIVTLSQALFFICFICATSHAAFAARSDERGKAIASPNNSADLQALIAKLKSDNIRLRASRTKYRKSIEDKIEDMQRRKGSNDDKKLPDETFDSSALKEYQRLLQERAGLVEKAISVAGRSGLSNDTEASLIARLRKEKQSLDLLEKTTNLGQTIGIFDGAWTTKPCHQTRRCKGAKEGEEEETQADNPLQYGGRMLIEVDDLRKLLKEQHDV